MKKSRAPIIFWLVMTFLSIHLFWSCDRPPAGVNDEQNVAIQDPDTLRRDAIRTDPDTVPPDVLFDSTELERE